MGFDPSVFWPAFQAAGMLEMASWSGGPDFPVGFEQPQRLDAGVAAFTTDYAIEYQVDDAPGLALGSVITIGGVTYKVKQRPELRGNGFFATAQLEKRQ